MTAPARFPTMLRTRPEPIALEPTGAATVWTIRVQAADAYDAVRVSCTPEQTIAEVKRAAMAVLLPDVHEHDTQMVKVHGAEIVNESVSLASVGVQDASTLFVTARRRRPLR